VGKKKTRIGGIRTARVYKHDKFGQRTEAITARKADRPIWGKEMRTQKKTGKRRKKKGNQSSPERSHPLGST